MYSDSLYILLAIDQIKQFTSPVVPREQADYEQQLFVARLSPSDETDLLKQYLFLSEMTFMSLPPQVHVWFLKLLIPKRHLVLESKADSRLTLVYMQYADDLVRRRIVELFYWLDQQEFGANDNNGRFLNSIWARIEKLPQERKESLVTEFTDILLDLGLQATLRGNPPNRQTTDSDKSELSGRFAALERFARYQDTSMSDFFQARLSFRFERLDRDLSQLLFQEELTERFRGFVKSNRNREKPFTNNQDQTEE